MAVPQLDEEEARVEDSQAHMIKIRRASEVTPEWGVLELQGALTAREGGSESALDGQKIGDLTLKEGSTEPEIMMGNQRIIGKSHNLTDKRVAVLRKKKTAEGTVFEVVGVINKKWQFKTRPAPVMSLAPPPAK